MGCRRSLGSSEGSSVPLQAIGASERVMYYLDKPVAAQIQGGDCVPSWSGKVSTNPFVPFGSLQAMALFARLADEVCCTCGCLSSQAALPCLGTATCNLQCKHHCTPIMQQHRQTLSDLHALLCRWTSKMFASGGTH